MAMSSIGPCVGAMRGGTFGLGKAVHARAPQRMHLNISGVRLKDTASLFSLCCDRRDSDLACAQLSLCSSLTCGPLLIIAEIYRLNSSATGHDLSAHSPPGLNR